VRLEDVFRDHQRSVYAYFLRSTGRPDVAEELTQETFFRACAAALRYRGDAPVVAWLFGIARRVLLESSRKGLFDHHAEVPDASAEPDLAQKLDLEHAFAQLAFQDRETLMLVDYLGFTPTEAAELAGIEAGAFRVRLHRARRNLRDRLKETP